MTPRLPRDLSGNELIRILRRSWGYEPVRQRGSHMILERQSPGGQTQPLTVPLHETLRVGTLASVISLIADHTGLSSAEITDLIRNAR